MRPLMRTQGLSHWLTVAICISTTLAQANEITVPFQSFKDAIKDFSSTSIIPIRTAIAKLEMLKTEIYPIQDTGLPAFPMPLTKTVQIKISGLVRGVDQANNELASSSIADNMLAELQNNLSDIKAKFEAYARTVIQIPEGFFTTPVPYTTQPTEIWTFIGDLIDKLVANGGFDNPEASAGRLLSFMFSAPLPENGVISLNFDSFEMRVRALMKFVDTFAELIDAPNADVEKFVTAVNSYDLPNALELETFLISGYENVQDMLKAYLKELQVVAWRFEELYHQLLDLWVNED